MQTETPVSTSSPQTWVPIPTAIAGAIAVVAKKRFTRSRRSPSAPDTYGKSSLDHSPLLAKLDANHKEVLSTIAAQGSAVDKRLDALESAVARLDERTKSRI